MLYFPEIVNYFIFKVAIISYHIIYVNIQCVIWLTYTIWDNFLGKQLPRLWNRYLEINSLWKPSPQDWILFFIMCTITQPAKLSQVSCLFYTGNRVRWVLHHWELPVKFHTKGIPSEIQQPSKIWVWWSYFSTCTEVIHRCQSFFESHKHLENH